ncbi:MAG: type II toxin-antitoxin system VapC family toxin [Terrimicrobiaceae bacterium]
MKLAILDSWALMAFFKGEPAALEVRSRFDLAAESGVPLALCVINWGEVVYQFERVGGGSAAESVISDIGNLPIEVVSADQDLTRIAASFKAKGGLSYADAFAAALAKDRKAELITGDPEFKVVEKEIKIDWLKRA